MRKGQIALLLLFFLVVLAFFALLNVDTFMSVRAKNRLQNGGDAAALAAARKQGALINEIGHLNIEHVVAAVRGDSNLCERIVADQRRIALLGPVEALRLANRAAKKNGMEERAEFGEILREHVKDIRLVYAGGGQAGDPYPEPFPGAWTDYATAIESVVSEGLATGPDNIEFYDAAGGHLLLNRQFYMAIAAKDWCWFFFHCYGVLSGYTSYHDWAPLPSRRDNPMDNSEIFSLHIATRKCRLLDIFTPDEIKTLADRHADVTVSRDDIERSLLIADPEQTWFLFDQYGWRRWFNGRSLADDEENYDFPLAGEVKEEYNVHGAAAVCRCARGVEAVAVDLRSDFTWSAAAKPFGLVEDLEGARGVVTGLRHFVVPAFTDVRLVPVDAVDGADLATADFGWVHHIRNHLGVYREKGPQHLDACFWCDQLKTWEHANFRREGVNWLKYNSGSCRRGGPGGGGGHGGTSRGH